MLVIVNLGNHTNKMSTESINFNWSCKHTWKRSAKNTGWCLLGCAIGDLGTILFFQITKIPFPVLGIMTLAIINGLITSIILETTFDVDNMSSRIEEL